MFKWLKKKTMQNLPSEIPNRNELCSITKEDCLKSIFEALKEHKASCYVSGIADDKLISFLESKGYKAKRFVNCNNYAGISITLVD